MKGEQTAACSHQDDLLFSVKVAHRCHTECSTDWFIAWHEYSKAAGASAKVGRNMRTAGDKECMDAAYSQSSGLYGLP